MSPDGLTALALRVRVSDPEGGPPAEHSFQRSPVRVGRGELNDLQLDRPYVSTWHGLIHFDDGGIRFVDLGSTNGTFLDGVRLQRNEAAPITPGQQLTIGRLRIELSRGVADAQAKPARPMTNFAKRIVRPARGPADAVSPAAASALALLERTLFNAPPPVAAPAPPASPATAPRPGPSAAASDPFVPAAVPGAFAAKPAAEPFRPAAPLDSFPPAAALDPFPPAAALDPFPPAAALDPVPPAAALDPFPSTAAPDAFLPTAAPDPFLSGADPEFVPAAFPAPPARGIAAERFADFPPPERSAAEVATPARATAAPPEGTVLGDEVLALVRSFAESYLPPDAVPTTAAGVERLLEALAEVLETAVRGYIELRRGQEQFGEEMGLRVPSGDGAIGRTGDASRLLGWLLEPAEGEARTRQLSAAFADLMIHHVALLNGIRAGAQALVAELSPLEVAQRLEREGRAGVPVWPLRQLKVLRTLEDRHRDFADEESAVTGVLFGKEFARAYSSVTGRRANAGGGEGPGPRKKTGKP